MTGNHKNLTVQVPPPGSSSGDQPQPSPASQAPSLMNKQLLSKLNKLLKEKQKIINSKDPKNPNLPQQGQFEDKEPKEEPSSPPQAAVEQKKPKKRITKQNSTRTDFFAAKLASAVDDVSLLDSDETFVYENNDGHEDVPNAVVLDDGSGPLLALPPNVDSINNAPQVLYVHENILAPGSVRNHTPLDPEALHQLLAQLEEGPGGAPSVQPTQPSGLSSVHPSVHHPSGLPSAQPSGQPSGQPLQQHPLQHQHLVVPSNAHAQHPQPLPAPSNLAMQPSVPSASAPGFPEDASIHSLQSSKWNLRLTVGAQTTPPARNVLHPIFPSGDFSNPYMDHKVREPLLYGRRKSSSHSLLPYDFKSRLPVLHYAQLLQNLQNPQNSNDVPYSYADDDDLMADDVSYQGDVNLVCTEDNQKLKTTSSKLRSTNSKLFDKRGAQPRRYLIIPDDVDIEDFDDELIYYDNLIRFPYNLQNSQNELLLLLGSGKLPHYRLLNLASINPRQKQYLKSKRYASLGYNPLFFQESENPAKGANPSAQKAYYDLDELEEDPDLVPNKKLSPHDTHFFLPRKISDENLGKSRMRCFRSFMYTVMSILMILAVGFAAGFLLALTKELADLTVVGVENALVSQDELVFSVVVEALNPGWFTVNIEHAELDIFAKSGYLRDDPNHGSEFNEANSVETVLLGTVKLLESALVFDGSFLKRALQQQVGDVKLVAPGRNLTGSRIQSEKLDDDSDNSDKWEIISKNPFDLILRGVLKYKLPFSKTDKTAAVSKVSYIDPTRAGIL